MFDFLKKKAPDNGIYAPANGQFISIEEVPDEVFAQKMMGDGFAIVPKDGIVYSPVQGTIASVFPTKHAIGIETANGQNVIVHMGIETVDLGGDPFEVYVKQGTKVTSKTKLAKMDLAKLAAEERNDNVIVVFPEATPENLQLASKDQVQQGDPVGKLL